MIPDKWMLLSIVYQHPQGISSDRLATIAKGKEAYTNDVNEVRNKMREHRNAGRITVFSDGVGDVIFVKRESND